MKKLVLALSLVVFLFGFVGCEKEPVENGGGGVLGGEEIEAKEIWLYEWKDTGITVTLEHYPSECKFHLNVTNPTKLDVLLGNNNSWKYYKLVDHELDGRMMYIKNLKGEFPTENDLYNKWFVRQHTEEVLVLEYAGILPGVPLYVAYYTFKRVE